MQAPKYVIYFLKGRNILVSQNVLFVIDFSTKRIKLNQTLTLFPESVSKVLYLKKSDFLKRR